MNDHGNTSASAMVKITRIPSKIEALPVRKQVALFEELVPWLWRMEVATGEQTTLEELREARFSGGLKCPHCDGNEVQRWGSTGAFGILKIDVRLSPLALDLYLLDIIVHRLVD